MAVYVDDVEHSFGRMKMCHLWADSTQELWDFAIKIGVDTKWIQGHAELSIGKAKAASWVHFDISKGKKAQAIELGAILTDKYGPSEHTARLGIASDDPRRAARGKEMLALIANARGLS